MSETSANRIPETYIEDYDKSLEIAYASKNERCMIVASHLVDSIIEQKLTPGRLGLLEQVHMAKDILDVYMVYPEAFKDLIKQSEKVDEFTVLDKLRPILRYGGVPLVQHDHQDYYKKSVVQLEDESSIKEQVAEALYDLPPNDKFKRDFKNELRIDNDQVSVDSVFHLLERAKVFMDDAARRAERTRTLQKMLEERTGSERLNLLSSFIRDTSLELDRKDDELCFEENVAAATANDETTIGELFDLWLEGRKEIELISVRRANKARSIFGLITSGMAATWRSDTAREPTEFAVMDTQENDK